jgi:transglutaminase-like putative cysteine protease
MADLDPAYLKRTDILDSDHPHLLAFARRAAGGSNDPVEQAVRIYYAVRDGIRYDPYYPFFLPEHYRASNVLASGRGYCVCKAALLCAAGRALGIPSRVGFATVRNHLATKQLIEFLGSDLFVYHGYSDFFLEGKWVKSTPAFNKELCARHRVAPLEFNGREDSIFQPFNQENHRFMEYLDFHGTFADIPVEAIVRAWEAAYGPERVRGWMAGFESKKQKRDFYQEEVVQ